ncbi:MAG TPA: hypothetical protein VOA88_10795 [Candidatus Dormibacteraeota bacterium]|nr:hypothetical protein [Candidatus Dormibacteraeota bacterium]
MVRKSQLFILIFSTIGLSLLSTSVWASPATLKCNSNRDQVWVYDSLNSFNVDAKLKCGQGVEIIERVQNYVKIRAQNGVEGYVPDAAVAGLPTFQPYRDSAHDVGLAAKQVQAVEVAKAAAHAASLAPADVNYSNVSPASASGSSNSAAAAPGKKSLASVSMAPPPALGALQPVSVSSAAKPAVLSAPTAAPATAISPATSASPANPAAESSAIPAPQPAKTPSPSAMNSGSAADSTTPVEQSNGACQSYFSAYGLTPSQTKWIAKNREKAFSQICPAPDPSKVDFVMIFTHDVDFFSGTMPDPVHKSGGFSDFTPMTSMDTALIPQSQADSARREYVWIFQFEKGTFDPATFSAKRRYQFSKMETGSLGSKAGVKTIEDAFRFVSGASH